MEEKHKAHGDLAEEKVAGKRHIKWLHPMTEIRLNCWEFFKCCRELGGVKAYEFGVCPASTDVRFDGIHYGVNAGRACWVIPESMCHGQKQGDFRSKFKTCSKCEFYARVKTEEGGRFRPTVFLLNTLNTDNEWSRTEGREEQI